MAKKSDAERIAELEAALAAEKEKNSKKIKIEVSEKKGVSLYGIRRFPITFYKDEWAMIFEQKDAIEKFIKENIKQLKSKE